MKVIFDCRNPKCLEIVFTPQEQCKKCKDKNWMEWINIKDRLPKMRKDVLLRVTVGDICWNIEQGYYKGNGEWVNCWCSRRNDDLYPITHWMELPKEPKEI